MKNISETEEEKLRNLGNGRTVRMRVLVLTEYTNNYVRYCNHVLLIPRSIHKC